MAFGLDNTKVSFKRGLEAKLPAESVSGTFYYTTDTNKFFLGLDDGEYATINKDVLIVDDMESVPTKNVKEGDFIYVKNSNIFAVYTGGQFVQVNPDTDTYLTTLTGTAVKNTDGIDVTITGTLNDTPDGGSKTVTSSVIKIKKDDIISFIPEAETPTVGLSSGDGDEGEVTITPKGTGFTPGTPVTVKGSGSVTVAQSADTITITGVDTKTNSKVTGATLTYADGGNLALQLTQDDGGTTVNANDGGKISAAITKVKTDLTTEITNQLKGLNPMTYKGTVGTAGTVTALPTASVAVGDVYMSNGTVASLGGQSNVKSGDLFVATGEEGADGFIPSTSIKWSYIPAGDEDDTDTQYKLTGDSGKINLLTTSDGASGSVTVASGNDAITTTVAGNTLTVTHKDYDQPTSEDGDAETPGFGGSFEVISAITTDHGHTTTYETKTITLPAEPVKVTDTNTLYNISSDGGVITLAPDGTNAGLDEESSVTIDPGTDITVSGTANTITVAHKAYNTASVTKKALTFIDGITLSNGHVTGTTVGTVTLPTYKLSGAAVTLAANKATATINLGGASTSSAKIGFTSSTLDFTGSTGTDVNVDIVWGTFGEE